MSPPTEQSAYLTQHMNKVSRSFALVVSCLEEPLQQQMSTAYLICRVLDNIEDLGSLNELVDFDDLESVEDGDTVIIRGNERLRPGQSVSIMQG